MQFLLDQLNFIGLNKKEVRVFAALSTFGRMNMTKISLRSGLSRTTVDAIVRRLMRQGLIKQEKISGHFEYLVQLQEVADKLGWIGERFRSNRDDLMHVDVGGEDSFESVSTTSIIPSDNAPLTTLDPFFRTHAGERVRILSAGNDTDKARCIQTLLHYIGLSTTHGLKSEVLLCVCAAESLRTQNTVSLTEKTEKVWLNIVPNSFCSTPRDIVVFRDMALLVHMTQNDVVHIRDAKILEAMRHLLDIACEAGWSVNLGAWLGKAL